MGEAKAHFSGHAFLDHEADIGLRATGDCWECAFRAGAAGLLELMAEPSAVRGERGRTINVSGHDIGALFVSWLNELLFLRDAEEMLFSSFDVSIVLGSGGYKLAGVIYGETLSQERHGLKTEVKAATFSGLKYGEEAGGCFVQCLLDL